MAMDDLAVNGPGWAPGIPTRTEALRRARKWSQLRMAAYLGLHQSQVSRLESGGRESGPVAKHLDRLAAEIAARDDAEDCRSHV